MVVLRTSAPPGKFRPSRCHQEALPGGRLASQRGSESRAKSTALLGSLRSRQWGNTLSSVSDGLRTDTDEITRYSKLSTPPMHRWGLVDGVLCTKYFVSSQRTEHRESVAAEGAAILNIRSTSYEYSTVWCSILRPLHTFYWSLEACPTPEARPPQHRSSIRDETSLDARQTINVLVLAPGSPYLSQSSIIHVTMHTGSLVNLCLQQYSVQSIHIFTKCNGTTAE